MIPSLLVVSSAAACSFLLSASAFHNISYLGNEHMHLSHFYYCVKLMSESRDSKDLIASAWWGPQTVRTDGLGQSHWLTRWEVHSNEAVLSELLCFGWNLVLDVALKIDISVPCVFLVQHQSDQQQCSSRRRKKISPTPSHQQQQHEPLTQGRMDPYFHVVYAKFWL